MREPSAKVAMLLPDLAGGGAQRVAVHLANGLAERGCSVSMVLIEAKGPRLADLAPSVRVVDLCARHALTSIPRLTRYLRRERPDVLFSHLDHVNVCALVARSLACVPTHVIPVVHVMHSEVRVHGRSLRVRVLSTAVRWLYPMAETIVTVSHGAAEDLIRVNGLPRGKVRVIYNPVITPKLRAAAKEPARHRWFAIGEPDVVMAMGRLTPPKDFATLLRAFAVLRKERRCRLLILGEGEQRAALGALIGELELTDCVDLPGFIDNPFPFLARCSLFVLSSASEALPTVLIEAMALGVPVVATDCPTGPREILHNGKYGRLVPAGRPDLLASAMRDALLGGRHYIHESVLQPFSLNTAIDEYVDLIEGVMHS